jgi:hypothetical protein
MRTGTAMAAAILAQAQLQGVAPAARLLAARAFTGSGTPGRGERHDLPYPQRARLGGRRRRARVSI